MAEQRERQGRKEETAQRRRRRDGTASQRPLKLAVPEAIAAKMAEEGRSVRWVNDTGNRMHQLTVLDDYDRVEGVDPVPVGTKPDGSPLMAFLCSKPTEFIEEDKRAAEKRRRETEMGMVKGQVPVQTDQGEMLVPVRGQLGAETYVDKATSIGRGNQIIE